MSHKRIINVEFGLHTEGEYTRNEVKSADEKPETRPTVFWAGFTFLPVYSKSLVIKLEYEYRWSASIT